LSWVDATAIFIGIILGAGVFEAPAHVASATSSTFFAAGLWLAGGFVAACGAFCYAECGARLPRTGGFFVYYREAYGEGAAFVGGWAATLVTYPASLAAIAHILARYLGELTPVAATSELHTKWAGASVLVAAGGLNILGVRAGANVQRLLTALKVLALALLCLAALAAPTAAPASDTTRELLPLGVSGVLIAMVILLWTVDGWSDVTFVAGELRDPGRNLGRTVVVGILVLTTLYVLVQVSVMLLLGAEAGTSNQVVADAVTKGLGAGAGRATAILVVLCTAGAINGTVLASSRLGFAMAQRGAFLPFFGVVDARFGTPARSIAALVAASTFYLFVADFDALLAFFSFNVWLFYAATAIALLILRRRRVGEPPEWRAPLGLLAPTVVLLTAAGMATHLVIDDPLRSLGGLAILVAGLPIYLVWRGLRSR
jgi:APA family basic amino acid/polyamine antiporter